MVSRPSNMGEGWPSGPQRAMRESVLAVDGPTGPATHGVDRRFGFRDRLLQRRQAAHALAVEIHALQKAQQLAPLFQHFMDATPALLHQVFAELVRAGDDRLREAAPVGRRILPYRCARAAHDREARTATQVVASRERHGCCATCARPWAGNCSQAERISLSRRLTSSSHSGLLAAFACTRRMHMYS